MAKLVYASADRAAAHRKLDELLGCTGHELHEEDPGCPVHGARTKPLKPFECRENPNSDQPFEVWDGPEPRPAQQEQHVPPQPTVVTLDDDQLDQLAAVLRERMGG